MEWMESTLLHAGDASLLLARITTAAASSSLRFGAADLDASTMHTTLGLQTAGPVAPASMSAQDPGTCWFTFRAERVAALAAEQAE